MRKLIVTIVGVSCCTATAYATEPQADIRIQPSNALLLSAEATGQGFLTEDPQPVRNLIEPFQASESSGLEDLTRVANSIAYVGTLILTADQVIRSMDSVLNRMALTQPDGTELRLNMRPSSGGFKVMLKLSRPIDF